MRIKNINGFTDSIPSYDDQGYYIVCVYNVARFKESSFATPKALVKLYDRPMILFYRKGAITTLRIDMYDYIIKHSEDYENFIEITF